MYYTVIIYNKITKGECQIESGFCLRDRLYVALSRSSGWDSIQLLHDFDNKIFRGSHDPVLVDEDKRSGSLNNQTKTWYEHMNTIETESGPSGTWYVFF